MADNWFTRKQAARRARLEKAAARADSESQRRYQAAHDILDGIPPGQPILVGHHSEKRHRRDLQRADNHMRKSIEADETAKELAHRAAAVGTGGISGDDPDAIEALRTKLTKLTEKRERMKCLNGLFRKRGTLYETDLLDEEERQDVSRYLQFGCFDWNAPSRSRRMR
jgi:hypothetical protein